MTMQTLNAFGAYVVMVFLTVAAPGPGQLMTIQNAAKFGWGAAMAGVAGLCLGTVLMSSLSVLGLGGLLQTLPQALWVAKLAGASYLLHLSWKAWRSSAPSAQPQALAGPERVERLGVLLRRGFLLQTVNPKPVLFFLAVLPPLVLDANDERLSLVRTTGAISVYLLALVLIHGSLAALVTRRRRLKVSHQGTRWLQRGSAMCFAAFALLLLWR
jgi:threonine/homoserine/homoserine lactone efflux protein